MTLLLYSLFLSLSLMFGLHLFKGFLAAPTGGLESSSAPRGSKVDSCSSNWTKLDSATDSTWVELRQIHQSAEESKGLRQTPHESDVAPTSLVDFRSPILVDSISLVHQNGSLPRSTKSTTDFDNKVHRGLCCRLVRELRRGLIFSSAVGSAKDLIYTCSNTHSASTINM